MQPTVTVKNKRDEVETMPLFANKDTISGEVGAGARGTEQCCRQRRRASAVGCAAALVVPAAAVSLTAPPPSPPLPTALLQVKVTPIPGRRTEHQGIRIQLLGEVELASERGHPHQFLSLGEGWRVAAGVRVPACKLMK